ncbi:inositol monophosphatase family protein [Halomarina litorea]|uniref:inositol monophosphatase family protein n=1 Tax=Halomarina litorea TaxID=2961595 RepID=UPI0020C5AED8|nr:inositol monophosphatase family protein [Halomarina sp. BCD28]
MLPTIEHTAVRATLAGGRHLGERFRANDADGEFSAHDVKAAADRASEERMLGVVEEAFPDHAVYSEERGEGGGEGDYRWIVDPLDGTNNFVAGMPSFASAATVLDSGDPVVASVYAPVADDLYVARWGGGVEYDGETVETGSDRAPSEATVGFVVGHGVKLDPDRAERAHAVRTALEDRCKRVVESWSPTVHWGLLARGRIDAMVSLSPDREEQYAGELLAREAGAVAREDGPLGVFAANESLCDSCWQAADSGEDQ